MNTSFKLKTTIFILMLTVVLLFLGVFALSAYQQSRALLQQEATLKAQRTMRQIEEKLVQIQHDMENDFISLSMLYFDGRVTDSGQLKQYIYQWEAQNGQLDYDFLLFSTLDGTGCTIATHIFVDLGETRCADIRAAIGSDINSRWRVVGERGNVFNVYLHTVEDKDSGRIIGVFIGGIVLSGNSFFLEKLVPPEQYELQSIALYQHRQAIAGVGEFDRESPLNAPIVTKKDSIDIYAPYPFADSELTIGISVSNKSIANLKDHIYQLLWFGAMLGLLVSAVIAVLLSKLIDRSLQSLLRFAQDAHEDRKTEWRDTHIEDFNLIGKQIVHIVSSLKVNEIALQQSCEKLEQSYMEKKATLHHLIKMQEIERSKIAQELHDDMGQSLTAVRVNMHLLGQNSALDDDARSLIATAQKTLNDIYDTVYNRIITLRPFELDEFGLAKSLPHICTLQQLRNLGYQVELDIDQGISLEERVETNLYRIAQEALSNIIKHANGNSVRISLKADAETVRMSIADNGVGIEKSNKRKGYGMMNMKERSDYIDGTLTIGGDPGTEISVEVANG